MTTPFYADLFRVDVNERTGLIHFWQAMKPNELTAVALPPVVAKELAIVLRKALKHIEQQSGHPIEGVKWEAVQAAQEDW